MFSRQIKLSIILTAIRRVVRSLRFSRCSSIISKIWCLLIMLRIKRMKMSLQNSWICVMFGACVIIRQEWETIMVWRWCRSSTSSGRWMLSQRVSITPILLLESWWENSFSSSFIDAFLLPLGVFFLVEEAPNLSFSLGEFSEIWGFFVSGFFSFLLIFVSVLGKIHGVGEKDFSHFSTDKLKCLFGILGLSFVHSSVSSAGFSGQLCRILSQNRVEKCKF